MNEPNATSRWKKYPGSRTRSEKLDKSATREKEALGPNHKSKTRGIS